MNIQIESRELSRIEYAKQQYKKHEIEVKYFETGDYIFNNKVAFEYKTMKDFIKSVQKGRVFDQAIRLNETFPYPFIMIEASDQELQEYYAKIHFKRKNKKPGHKPRKFYEKEFYGAIASLNRICTVIRCPTQKRCFDMMETQAKKIIAEEPVQRKIAKTGNPAYQCLRYCIGGVGPKTTAKIITQLQLETIKDVVDLTADKLTKVNGISRSRAEQITAQINGISH